MKENEVMINALADITNILTEIEVNDRPIGFFDAIDISEKLLNYIETHFNPKTSE
jgi:hypothetical protein